MSGVTILEGQINSETTLGLPGCSHKALFLLIPFLIGVPYHNLLVTHQEEKSYLPPLDLSLVQ